MFDYHDYFKEYPWIDGPHLEPRLKALLIDHHVPIKFRTLIETWRKDGVVHLKKAAPMALIDELLRDFREVEKHPERFRASILHENYGITSSNRLRAEDFDHPRFRMMDFHRESLSGKRLALLPEVIQFVRAVLGDRPVAMQTLLFKRGSEERPHQDISVVVSQKPAFLVGAWLALEDVHPDAGPLVYYPGSHRIPLFDFGNGPIRSTSEEFPAYWAHNERECKNLGSLPRTATIKKGDVVLWHGALVHAGGRVNNPSLTRHSFVIHYSSNSAYRRDRRIQTKPRKFNLNGATLYKLAQHFMEENTFPTSPFRFDHWSNEARRFAHRASRKLVRSAHRFAQSNRLLPK